MDILGKDWGKGRGLYQFLLIYGTGSGAAAVKEKTIRADLTEIGA